MPEEDDELDGLCDDKSQPPETPDKNVDALVLFADVEGDERGIQRRKKELTDLAASQERLQR